MTGPDTIVVSVDRAAEILGCSRRRVFELLADGVLERAPRLGRRLRIYTESVLRAVARPEPRTRKRRRLKQDEAPDVRLEDLHI